MVVCDSQCHYYRFWWFRRCRGSDCCLLYTSIQQSLIASAEEALDLAVMAYEQTRQRFIIGKADVNSPVSYTHLENELPVLKVGDKVEITPYASAAGVRPVSYTHLLQASTDIIKAETNAGNCSG